MTSKKIALNGILIALTVIILFAETVAPTNKLSLYVLSSFMVAVVIMESGIKAGWAFYAASCILCLLIIPDKIAVTPYVAFFGLYGIVKFYLERMHRIPIEYAVKLLYFNISLAAAVYLLKEYIYAGMIMNYPLWIAIAGLEVVFIIYDYVYTLFIRYYREKLKKILRI